MTRDEWVDFIVPIATAVTGIVATLFRKAIADLWAEITKNPGRISAIRRNAAINVSIDTSLGRLLGALGKATRVGVCELHNGVVDTSRYHTLRFSCINGVHTSGVSSVKDRFQNVRVSEMPHLLAAATDDADTYQVLCRKALPELSREAQEMATMEAVCTVVVRLPVTLADVLTHFMVITFDECDPVCLRDNKEMRSRVLQAAAEVTSELRRRL